ncbi:NADH-dependent alcohol dehydrogenase [Vallitalea longa]|uniref:NADH-dependent alcohol dehydrogenase n=1 Tax=Vallitalea longa TaxID=2936439 RepID=A0A9W5Y921_9FIRM|nr:iron-containing alcohol dehydrogenase [Vallitalea longa]GKX28311.1 NADH-dependent alcohol dehydrogenase [Vallitalea longa]
MKNFEYYSPVKILFGQGKRHSLGEEIKDKYKRVLLAVSKGPFRENGTFKDIKDSLEKQGIQVFEMGDIDSNPRLSSVVEGAEICKENDIECVIALGGGSAMDCSKVIAAAAKTDVNPYNFLWGDKVEMKDSLDVITIPTIAATGTEVNNWAVIVDDDTKEKGDCQIAFPTIALMDPEIFASAPLRLTLWGAMDILSHTFEFYFNGYTGSIFQSRFSESILLATMECIERLVKDEKDIEARGELMWCAVMAWGGLTKIGREDPDMACHSIEVCFSGYLDTHHGACLGVMTPRWMEMTYKEAPEIFARFARNVMGIEEDDDLEAAKLGVAKYKAWLKQVGAPNTYFDIGNKEFNDEQLNHVAKTAWKIYDGNIGRIKKWNLEEIIELLSAGRIKY